MMKAFDHLFGRAQRTAGCGHDSHYGSRGPGGGAPWWTAVKRASSAMVLAVAILTWLYFRSEGSGLSAAFFIGAMAFVAIGTESQKSRLQHGGKFSGVVRPGSDFHGVGSPPAQQRERLLPRPVLGGAGRISHPLVQVRQSTRRQARRLARGIARRLQGLKRAEQ